MRIDKNSWLITRPVAHRGLWNDKIIENSRAAYENAVKNNYPIEIDLYSTTDGKLMSFHDVTLNRMTGKEGFIYDKTYDELKSITLNNSTETIPTFDEVLEIVNEKVPLLIELKNQPDKSYIDNVIKTLNNYKGEFAIQGFDPFYIKHVKDVAPQFIRGILATKTYGTHEKFIKRFVLKNMSFNFLIKPDFISYSYPDLPLKKSKTKGKAVLCWTVTTQKDYEKLKPFCDNIIFEHFIPEK